MKANYWSEHRTCPWCREPWLAYGRTYATKHGLRRMPAGKRYCSRKCSNAAQCIKLPDSHFRMMAAKSAAKRKAEATRTPDYLRGYKAGYARARYRCVA